MIEGIVNANYEAVISLSVQGPSGQVRQVEAVVDTGFNRYLVLPPALVTELKLPFATRVRVVLADGSDGLEEPMTEAYRKFDAADYIRTEEDVRELLRAAVDEDTGDGAVIRAALRHVARTRNMSALARDTGLNRGNLYEALSEDGNPTLATLLKITNALGLRLSFEPVEDRLSKPRSV